MTVFGSNLGWLQLRHQKVRTAVALTAAGIGVALVCGLAWLAFVRRAAMIERTERRVLGPPLNLQRGGRADVRSRAGRH